VSPRNFSGQLFEFPGRISPKNSVFEAMERRRVEGEEAVRSIARQKVLAKESGRRGPAAKESKSGRKRRDRNREFRDEFAKWKRRSGNSRKGPEQFWDDIVDSRWPLRERLRRQLTGKRQFREILTARPRTNGG
jgi:hypothetical protein